MKNSRRSPFEKWTVEIMQLITLIVILPIWPVILFGLFVVNYIGIVNSNRGNCTTNPFKVFLYTMALSRKVTLDELNQYRNRQGRDWDERTEHWMPWSYKIKYPLLIASCFIVLVLTSFINSKITKDTKVSELVEMYLL